MKDMTREQFFALFVADVQTYGHLVPNDPCNRNEGRYDRDGTLWYAVLSDGILMRQKVKK